MDRTRRVSRRRSEKEAATGWGLDEAMSAHSPDESASARFFGEDDIVSSAPSELEGAEKSDGSESSLDNMGPWKDLLEGFIADFENLDGDIQYALIGRLHQIGATDKAEELWKIIEGRDRMPGGQEYSDVLSKRLSPPRTTVFFSDNDEKDGKDGSGENESNAKGFPLLSVKSLFDSCREGGGMTGRNADDLNCSIMQDALASPSERRPPMAQVSFKSISTGDGSTASSKADSSMQKSGKIRSK